jgi:hypothetical protein
MAGYSGTPLVKKLGVKPGQRLVLLHGPHGWGVPDLPAEVDVGTGGVDGADVVIAFYRRLGDLQRDAPTLAAQLRPAAMLWIAWPRKAAGHVSDISERDLREALLPTGLVDVKVAALDDDWSGLKFVWRKERR